MYAIFMYLYQCTVFMWLHRALVRECRVCFDGEYIYIHIYIYINTCIHTPGLNSDKSNVFWFTSSSTCVCVYNCVCTCAFVCDCVSEKTEKSERERELESVCERLLLLLAISIYTWNIYTHVYMHKNILLHTHMYTYILTLWCAHIHTPLLCTYTEGHTQKCLYI